MAVSFLHFLMISLSYIYQNRKRSLGSIFKFKFSLLMFIFIIISPTFARSLYYVSISLRPLSAYERGVFGEHNATIGLLQRSNKDTIEEIKKILPYLRDKGSLNVLEVGCGDGTSTELLLDELKASPQEIRLIAIDPDNNGLKTAVRRLNNVRFLNSTIKTPSFAQESFDLVVSLNTLHMLGSEESQSIAIENIFNSLKPGGYFVFNVPFPVSGFSRELQRDEDTRVFLWKCYIIGYRPANKGGY